MFNITIKLGLKRVEFLDVIMDMNSDTYRPYQKSNSKTIYMNNYSNHPNYIKKQLPNMINNRLNAVSKTKSDFEFIKPNYQDALEHSNYKQKLCYSENAITPNPGKRKRRRKIIYFQPPFSLAVKTPIGKIFLKLVKKHFTTANPLQKILNAKSLKISYCCMSNAKSEITSYNKQLLSNKATPQDKTCNCRSKVDPCPLQGYCLTNNLVYRADITTKEGDHKIYIGTSGNSFKERYNGHTTTLKIARKLTPQNYQNIIGNLRMKENHRL